MTYQTTMTRKGQITIPQKIREVLGLKPFQRILINLGNKKKEATIKSAEDILDLAGSFKPKSHLPILKARGAMEKIYKKV